MSQQASIVILIDTPGALESNSLEDHLYMIDNSSFLGSTGQGTSHLVTALKSTYAISNNTRYQTKELYLNWLVYSLGGLPATLPRNYFKTRAINTVAETARKFTSLAGLLPKGKNTVDSMSKHELIEFADKYISVSKELPSRELTKGLLEKDANDPQPPALMDLEGNLHSARAPRANTSASPPQLMNITGPAVDAGILNVAQQGSPNSVVAGWYWLSTVHAVTDVHTSYTMEFDLFPVGSPEPVRMSHTVSLHITAEPARNGFTGGYTVPVLPVG